MLLKKLFLALSLFFLQNIFTREYITGNQFKACVDYIVEERVAYFNPIEVQEKSTIFVDVYSLPYFFSRVFPYIKNSFFLITHNGDGSAPGEFAKYLNDPRIIVWCGQNCDLNHPKLIPIPIGIANPHWPHGNAKIMEMVLDYLEENPQREQYQKLYINFSVDTAHPDVRRPLYPLFENKSFAVFASRKPWKEYLLEMAQYQFVLSPFGGGLDCLRTWEALLVGSIPVVKTSTLDSLYADLPVIIVKNWDEITEEFLEKKYQEIIKKTYNREKLFI